MASGNKPIDKYLKMREKIGGLIQKIPFAKHVRRELEGYSFAETLNLFFSKHDELILLDVGSNIGQSIKLFLKHFPNSKIFSFEPTPELYQLLITKFKTNPNIKIFKTGLGNKEGTTTFFQSEHSPTNSILRPNIDLYKSFDSELVQDFSKLKEIKIHIKTLSKWYNENLKDKMIDLLKIDTQGFDYDVLEGGVSILANKVKSIMCEIQFLDFYENSKPYHKIFELLYQSGFFLINFFDLNRFKNIHLLECNAFFLNKNSFNLNLMMDKYDESKKQN